MRRGPKKSFKQRREEFLGGIHEEAEIQCKSLRQGNYLAFIKDTYLEKEGVWSKVHSRKVGAGLKGRQKLNKRRLAWWRFTVKKEALHLLGLRGRHQYSDQRSNWIRASCVASTAVGTKGEEDKMASLSA